MHYFSNKLKKNKNKLFFVTPKKEKLSYQEFNQKSVILASYLYSKNGSLKNKRVLLNMDRGINYFIVVVALIKLGAVIIPISNKLKLIEVNYIKKKYKPLIEINKIPFLKKKLSMTKELNNENSSRIIFFTSGTTGEPKGIQHKISKLFMSAIEFSKLSNYSKKDIVLHNWPHYYMAGFFNMFLCPMVSGSTIYFTNEIGVDTYLKYWSLLLKNKITKSYLSPTMAQAVINYSNYNKLPKNKKINTTIFSTGSYLYSNIYKNFKSIFEVYLKNCYGVTEAGASISLADKNESDLVGKLSKGIFIKLSKKKEIMIKSNYFFEGYLDNEGKLKRFNKKYFNSGDLGEKRKNSKYYIIGRNKEIIKKGGEQISLLKIENISLGFKNIKDVLAKGVKSEFWGEEVELDIVFKNQKKSIIKKINNNNKILLNKFLKYLSIKLTKIEMPKNISIVKHIPKTSIGKNYRKIF